MEDGGMVEDGAMETSQAQPIVCLQWLTKL